MKRRPSLVDEDDLAKMEADLDLLEALLRRSRKAPVRRGVPAVGGGTLCTRRDVSKHLRPRPAAFARAIGEGLDPIPAAFQAGYRSPNRMTVWRLLRDERVKAEIERFRALANASERHDG